MFRPHSASPSGLYIAVPLPPEVNRIVPAVPTPVTRSRAEASAIPGLVTVTSMNRSPKVSAGIAVSAVTTSVPSDRGVGIGAGVSTDGYLQLVIRRVSISPPSSNLLYICESYLINAAISTLLSLHMN